jgi:hypothetical protein
VIIVGSQAILGTYTEDQLPFYATRSVEIDVLPIADNTGEIARLADEIEGAAGEFSPFEQLHGFSIDAVDLQTSALPDGWRDRLVKVQNENTAAPSGEPQFIGWCLDKEDLCVAKLCAPPMRIARSSTWPLQCPYREESRRLAQQTLVPISSSFAASASIISNETPHTACG